MMHYGHLMIVIIAMSVLALAPTVVEQPVIKPTYTTHSTNDILIQKESS
ncbi:Uncharacterised protein [Enterobacter cloacae]|nr:Uncharacterised protein [Enterobacter cloacae]